MHMIPNFGSQRSKCWMELIQEILFWDDVFNSYFHYLGLFNLQPATVPEIRRGRLQFPQGAGQGIVRQGHIGRVEGERETESGIFAASVLRHQGVEEGRRVGGRRHRVHHDREKGLGARLQAPFPVSPLLYFSNHCE